MSTTATRCRTATGGTINKTTEQALNALGGNLNNCYAPAAIKTKNRSVFVNGKINAAGGFAMIQELVDPATNVTKHFTNPNQEGSAFAIDGDNDCIYEEEDNLVNWLVANQFDEINLYNVSHILSHGSDILESVVVNELTSLSTEDLGWLPTTHNLMQEEEKAEYHLHRFIHKVKSNGIAVNVIMSSSGINHDNATDFYTFSLDATNNNPPAFEVNYACHFVYEELLGFTSGKRSGNQDVSYIRYADATELMYPRDARGRISIYDKQLIDIFNLHVFNYRALQGLITPSPQSCSGPINAIGCSGTFDALLFEGEWWNHPDNLTASSPLFYPDEELKMLNDVVEFAKCLGEKTYAEFTECDPGYYGVADNFSHPNWVNQEFTEQQRANIIDQLYDRIYLYSYHSNPCDCYNSTVSSYIEKEFHYKVNLLRNNQIGSLQNVNGVYETEIYPVFSAEFFEPDATSRYHYTRPRRYGIDPSTNTQCAGCDGSGSQCDYCTDYSGRFLNALNDHIVTGNAQCGTNAGKRMGFVENIFQQQYNLDPQTSSAAPMGDNQINGYAWLKSSTLFKNSVSTKTGNPYTGFSDQSTNAVLTVYPNPAKEFIKVEFDERLVKELIMYNEEGVTVYRKPGFDAFINTAKLTPGVYYVSVILLNHQVQTVKFVKQ